MDVEQLIREGARKVSSDPEAAALFECLRPHLLSPDHDVGSMLRACGAVRAQRRRLAKLLGPLKTWVTKLRMTEAARLVRDTRDTDEAIGRRLGYSTERGFRDAFRRVHSVSPAEMRRQARGPRDPVPPAGDAPSGKAGKPTGAHRLETPRARANRRRRRAALGLVDVADAVELRGALRRRHPRLDREAAAGRHPAAAGEPPPVELIPTGDHLEDVVTDAVLDRVLQLPEAEQRFALLEAVSFTHPGPLYELFNRCMRMAPADPERAVATAELAVRLVEAHREMMGDAYRDWQAVAWARLGRVQAHLGDGGAAERSVAAARAELGDGEWTPRAEVEIRRVEGMARKLERRWDQAVRAVDRAVELTRSWARGDLDRWQVLFQRLELASAMADAEAGLAFADELEELLDAWLEEARRAGVAPVDERLTVWRGFVSYQRGKAHAAAGDDPFAEHFLRRALDEIAADPACDDDDQLGILFTLALHELARVGSRIGRPGDDELLVRQALDRYRVLAMPLLEASAEAELAVLCALRGAWAEARQLAGAAAAFLDDLPFHREAWGAARRLRTLLDAEREWTDGELSRVLEKVRRDLDLVVWEIPGPQATAATWARMAREEDELFAEDGLREEDASREEAS